MIETALSNLLGQIIHAATTGVLILIGSLMIIGGLVVFVAVIASGSDAIKNFFEEQTAHDMWESRRFSEDPERNLERPRRRYRN